MQRTYLDGKARDFEGRRELKIARDLHRELRGGYIKGRSAIVSAEGWDQAIGS